MKFLAIAVAAMFMAMTFAMTIPVKAETTVGTFVVVQDGQAYYFEFTGGEEAPEIANAYTVPVPATLNGLEAGKAYLLDGTGHAARVLDIHIHIGDFVKVPPYLFNIIIRYQQPEGGYMVITGWKGYIPFSITVNGKTTYGQIFAVMVEGYGTLVNAGDFYYTPGYYNIGLV